MRHSTMQKKIEKISSEILDDLAEELELEFPFYPNVVWVGKNKLKFEGLGMPKCYRDDFETAEELCARAIEEMLGFFGSKLIFPERNIGDWKFSRYDCLSKKFSGWDETYRQICDYTQDNLLENLFSHQQGYSLGENL